MAIAVSHATPAASVQCTRVEWIIVVLCRLRARGVASPLMASIRLTALSKSYRAGSLAVDGASLAIADAEFVVLVGPSGCGKSTLLRMIAGLEECTKGTIEIDGRVVNDVAPRDRDIAMVFQNYALYPHLSVRGNMRFGLDRRRSYPSAWRALVSGEYRRRRRDESQQIEERVRSAARTLGIEPLLHRAPRELSGGQRQRVALGRALVRNPSVFLFDEPLSNLDALLRSEMRTELRILHRSLKATMVYVTHDQEEAMSLADRIVVLRDGVVQQVGAPTELYERPTNRFVAGFIGTPTMNMLEGTFDRVDGADAVVSWHGRFIRLPASRWGALGAQLAQGCRVVVGIRPDRLAPCHPETPGSVPGRLVAIERYGAQCDLVADVGPVRVTARCGAERVGSLREGDPISMAIDGNSAHLFDECGQALATSR